MKLSIIIPAYNEAENINRFPEELVPYLDSLGCEYEIIIIDDGSKDNTADTVTRLSLAHAVFVRHEVNRGIAQAIRAGISKAHSDLTVMLDADLTFHPRYIKDLLTRYLKGDIDFVVGSPALAGYDKHIAWYRRVISQGATAVYAILFGRKITAVSPIFRLYKTADLKALKLESTNFDITTEILFKLIAGKKTYAEIPVPLTARIFGISKLNYKKEVRNHARLIKKILIWRLKSLLGQS